VRQREKEIIIDELKRQGVVPILEAYHKRLRVHDSMDASDAVRNEVSQFFSCFCLNLHGEVVSTKNAINFLNALDFRDLLFDSFHEIQSFA
jgi:hypothetical protein